MLLIFYLFLRKYIYNTTKKALNKKSSLTYPKGLCKGQGSNPHNKINDTPSKSLRQRHFSKKNIYNYNPNLKRNHWNSKLRFHCPMSPPIRPSQDLLPNHEERSPAERTPNHSDCLIPQNSSYTFLFHHFSHVSSSFHLLAFEFLKFPEKRSIHTPLLKHPRSRWLLPTLWGPQSHPFQVVSDHKIIAVGAWM